MLARHEFAASRGFDRHPRRRSVRTFPLDAHPSDPGHWVRFRRNVSALHAPLGDPTGNRRLSTTCCREWRAPATGWRRSRFIWGFDEEEVRERAASLGIAQPAEKPLRRPTSANPWSVWDVRLLIALWLDNVSAASIAATLGRSPSEHPWQTPLARAWRARPEAAFGTPGRRMPRDRFAVEAEPRRQRDRRRGLFRPRAGLLPVVRGDRSARSVPGRGQMGARPGQGKGQEIFDPRLCGLESPGDRSSACWSSSACA